MTLTCDDDPTACRRMSVSSVCVVTTS
jgi:hypothetical protein